MIKDLHVALAYLTVGGFVVRGVWALTDAPLRRAKWVRIAPHVVDTLLLALGIALAVHLSLSPFSGWLAAKMVGLVAYIGFGVLTMRASSKPLQIAGFVAALLSAGYVFAVAWSRAAWPF